MKIMGEYINVEVVRVQRVSDHALACHHLTADTSLFNTHSHYYLILDLARG